LLPQRNLPLSRFTRFQEDLDKSICERATSINNLGVITGYFANASTGAPRGFVRQP